MLLPLKVLGFKIFIYLFIFIHLKGRATERDRQRERGREGQRDLSSAGPLLKCL